MDATKPNTYIVSFLCLIILLPGLAEEHEPPLSTDMANGGLQCGRDSIAYCKAVFVASFTFTSALCWWARAGVKRQTATSTSSINHPRPWCFLFFMGLLLL
jgi:hypothetical protein